MSTENEIFTKIREISMQMIKARPQVYTQDLVSSLGINRSIVITHLEQLKKLRLISFTEAQAVSVRLTLLGSVVTGA